MNQRLVLKSTIVFQQNTPKADLLSGLFDRYQDSSDFTKLADKTRTDYDKHLRSLAHEFGDFPIEALTDQRTRSMFLDHRDTIALKSPRHADYQFAVFARAMSWAKNRGLIAVNPIKRPGRVYRSSRRDTVWLQGDEEQFLIRTPPHMHLPLKMALWTGQRQGDLLRAKWVDYDGAHLTFKQGKTGARVKVPVARALRAALDTAKDKARTIAAKQERPFSEETAILTNARGVAWTPDGFRTSWRKACAEAKISGLTFHDLRGTAVTRFALAGSSIPEITSITGHSMKDATSILEAHYMARDPKLGESAMRKLEKSLENSQLDSQPASSAQSTN